jgi:hypothetical protein
MKKRKRKTEKILFLCDKAATFDLVLITLGGEQEPVKLHLHDQACRAVLHRENALLYETTNEP